MCDAEDIGMAEPSRPGCTDCQDEPPRSPSPSPSHSDHDLEEQPEEAEEPKIALTLSQSGTISTLHFPASSTLSDLTSHLSTALSIPYTPTSIKLLAPGFGMLKDPALPLAPLVNKKITLLTTSPQKLEAMNHALALSQQRLRARATARRRARPITNPHADRLKMEEEAKYTFHSIRPLAHLPNPGASQKFLERIRDDPGIKHIMRLHRYSVPVLTEMDPREHTTHEGKTLGLNQNYGQVIMLRLLTDDGTGYRDYKTVRMTAVHELAHNEHMGHGAEFWALFRLLMKECEGADMMTGGRRLVGGSEFYEPPEGAGEEADERGWTGGVHVLGGADVGKEQGGEELSPRERAARAAEERMKRQKKGGAS